MPKRKRSDLSRMSNRARKTKQRRQLESEFDKQLRRDIQRECQAKRRANESEDEQAIRRNFQRQRQAEIRANESENRRHARLSKQRERNRILRSLKSENSQEVAFEQVILKTDPEDEQSMKEIHTNNNKNV